MANKNLHLPAIRGQYKYNEPMKNYTWLNVGGPAEVMFFPQDIEDLQKFMREKPQDTDVFVLGGGSNLLVRDQGIHGVVIKMSGPEFSRCVVEDGFLCCDAGMKNFNLKDVLLKNQIGGLEFLCSIPGSIGGAVKGNAGCFGSSMSDVTDRVSVMDGTGNIFTVSSDQLGFDYRQSHFPSDWIILKVWLKYEKSTVADIQNKIDAQRQYRLDHQPQGIRTAGSTFKNPQGFRAWELIQKSGVAQLKVGGAKMSDKHCNFIENDGTASAAEIESLCDQIIWTVKEKTGVCLEWEIQRIGEGKDN